MQQQEVRRTGVNQAQAALQQRGWTVQRVRSGQAEHRLVERNGVRRLAAVVTTSKKAGALLTARLDGDVAAWLRQHARTMGLAGAEWVLAVVVNQSFPDH